MFFAWLMGRALLTGRGWFGGCWGVQKMCLREEEVDVRVVCRESAGLGKAAAGLFGGGDVSF